jgi:hypothetical protein
MSTDLIRYDLLVQEALRGVVRKVLTDAAHEGLPGEHHFYISFRTDAPGVRVPQRMRDKFPEEMTIILQHQFWDLIVGEQHFEVGLSFSNVPEKVVVPYDALTGFFDPSVQFGLKFEVQDTIEEGANDTEPMPANAAATLTQVPRPPRESDKPRGAGSEPAEIKPAVKSAGKAKSEAKPDAKAEKSLPAPAPAEAADEPAHTDAKVVSIDAFRKKT